MNKKISVKLLSFVGALFFIGILSNILSLASVSTLEDKSNMITEQCLTAVNLLSETSRSVERVQRFAKDTSDGEENSDMEQENNGLVGLFTQLEEIITGFKDENISEAFQNYQAAYTDYTMNVGQMNPGEPGETTEGLQKEQSETAISNVQEKQVEMEEYSLALDEAYQVLNDLIQDKVTSATETMSLQTTKTKNMTIVMSAIMLALGVIIGYITVKTIINPLKSAKKQIEEIILGIEQEKGDLTKRIHTRNHDELGALVQGINKFIDRLQKTMERLKLESDKLGGSADTMNTQVDQSKESVRNVSSIMDELSAGMEEATATVEEFGTGITNVTTSLDDINMQVENGHELSRKIKERSNTYQINAKQGQKMTGDMVYEMRSSLTVSLEKSKSVEKIKQLTEEILEISSQTNLLALNASIEAARAGAAGAGFTVVAEQIRTLADSSRATANDIQEISELVMDGVDSLASDSKKIIEYVDSSILKDYQQFVDITSQYNSDAESVNDMIGEVAVNATTLTNTMNQMKTGVSEIITTINESTKGIMDVAASTSGLVQSMEQMKGQADANQEIGKALMDEVDVFKKISV